MSNAPTLNGQVLGEAAHATRALLDRVLADTATTFHQSVVMNATTASGGTAPRTAVVARMVGALKIDAATAESTIAELVAAGLVTATPGEVALTDAGRARHDAIRAPLGEVTARLYAGLSAEDLATAGRVLTTLTARANEELATA